MEEIAVKHRHVGYLSKFDGAHAVLLMPDPGNVDGHSLKRLLAGNGFGGIHRHGSEAREQSFRNIASLRHIETQFDAHHGRDRIV